MMRRRTPRTTQRKEESEQQSEGTTDDAWWLASMNALTREPRVRWALRTPQKGATNRFAVLAEPDTHGVVNAATNAASGIQRKTTKRHSNLGARKKASWSQASEWCGYSCVPRVHYLMKETESKAVWAVAKDTPRAGFRFVVAAVDSEAGDSVAPPNVFPGEIHASAIPRRVASTKLRSGSSRKSGNIQSGLQRTPQVF